MKLTQTQLRQIIREEIQKLKEYSARPPRESSKEFKEGWDAYERGTSIKKNPYSGGNRKIEWMSGWKDAEAEYDTRGPKTGLPGRD